MAIFKVEAHELESEPLTLRRRHRGVADDPDSAVVPVARDGREEAADESCEESAFHEIALPSTPYDSVAAALVDDDVEDIAPLPPLPAPPALQAEGEVVRWLDRRELLALRAAALHVWSEDAPCPPPIPARVVRAIVATEDVLRATEALARHAAVDLADAGASVDGLVRDTHDWVATILSELEDYARANEDPDEALDLWGTASRAFAEEAATCALARVLPRVAALEELAGLGPGSAPVQLHVASAGAWLRRSVARQVRVLRELAIASLR